MGPKAPKPDVATENANKRARNRATEDAQAASAARANEAIRVSRQGRKQLLFGGTGALGVTSPLGGA